MPKYRITAPDGQSYDVTAPDGASEADLLAYAQRSFKMAAGPLRIPATAGPSGGDSTLGRSAAGAALGISDIGNTALNALAYLPGKVSPAVAQWNRTRNADFDALTEQNKDSTAFKVARVGANIAATLPVGGALGELAAMIPGVAAATPGLVAAIRSGGFTTGAPIANPLLNLATRTAGGTITGGATAGLVNPDDAGAGALIGGALPGAVKVAGVAGGRLASAIDGAAERLMQSAIKPTIKQLKTGDAATAVRMLLDYGINPTMGGVQKLRSLIGDLNTQITDRIAASPATIDKQAVVNRLADVRKAFGNQVSPTADLNAIQGVADDFLAHPSIPGSQIPVQLAQDMKQGTYKVLSKKYGQMGGAEVEAQKGLARGLKEEIANAVPEIAGLNAQESKLITTLNVTERRALMEMNKNPMGLASLASNPASWAAFMADKSALFKSLTARMLNSSNSGLRAAAPALENAMAKPVLRNSALVIGANE